MEKLTNEERSKAKKRFREELDGHRFRRLEVFHFIQPLILSLDSERLRLLRLQFYEYSIFLESTQLSIGHAVPRTRANPSNEIFPPRYAVGSSFRDQLRKHHRNYICTHFEPWFIDWTMLLSLSKSNLLPRSRLLYPLSRVERSNQRGFTFVRDFCSNISWVNV